MSDENKTMWKVIGFVVALGLVVGFVANWTAKHLP